MMLYVVHVEDRLKNTNRTYQVEAESSTMAEDTARRLLARENDRAISYIKVVKTFGAFHNPAEDQMPFKIIGISENDSPYGGMVEQFCDELRIYLNGFGNYFGSNGSVVTLAVDDDGTPAVYVFDNINTPTPWEISLDAARQELRHYEE